MSVKKESDRTAPEEAGAEPEANQPPEEIDLPVEESRAEIETVDELQARLKEAERERAAAERAVQDYADRFRRAQSQLQAENEELRARLQRNFEQRLETARGDIVASLLESLDNLKRAIAAAEKSTGARADFNALLAGVRATAAMFEGRMQDLGLENVPSEGEEFNPELHEAVDLVSVDEDQDNRVVAELQPGYRIKDRLLRPARVRVGRAGS
jgi:molecular chaperone GrpE